MHQTDTIVGQIERFSFITFGMFLFIFAALPAAFFAQETPIRIETELAVFEVAVTDENGEPVKGLRASDFRIFENGVERSIDMFRPITKTNDGRPLSIVFALDVSGSMTADEIDKLTEAMRIFVDRLADYNSYFAVLSFAMEVKQLRSFTNRPDKLHSSLRKLHRRQDGLSTHAYDAVDDAIRMIERKAPKEIRGKTAKRAVVVITDGFPVGDTVSPATVIERANDAETSIYAVVLPSYSRTQRSGRPVMTPLEASGLVERTGGRTFYAEAVNFEKLFAALMEEITASYAIAFYPDEGEKDADKFNTVRIESRDGYNVRQNRSGYRTRETVDQ